MAFRRELSDEFYGQLDNELDSLVSSLHCGCRVSQAFLHSPLYNLRALKRGYRGSIDWLLRIKVDHPDPEKYVEAKGEFEITFHGFRCVKFREIQCEISRQSRRPFKQIEPDWPRRSGEIKLIAREFWRSE
ncbi:hypothetical protein ACXR0O_23345 [Verrucomicrobiota bacterium sgz303538]